MISVGVVVGWCVLSAFVAFLIGLRAGLWYRGEVERVTEALSGPDEVHVPVGQVPTLATGIMPEFGPVELRVNEPEHRIGAPPIYCVTDGRLIGDNERYAAIPILNATYQSEFALCEDHMEVGHAVEDAQADHA